MASPRKSGFGMAKHSIPYDSHVPPKKRQNLIAATLSESDDSEEESRPSFGGLGMGGPNANTADPSSPVEESRPSFGGFSMGGPNVNTADPSSPVEPPQQLGAGDTTDTTPDVARDFLVKPNAEPVYNSFAAKMMAKMGYQKGKGLGKHGQGRVGIIEASKQRGRRGLGLTIKAFEPSDVSWDYSKEHISAEEEVKWMPKCDAEIPDLETLRTWVTEGPRQHSLKDDYEFCTEKLVEDVNKCKSVFDELEPEEMRRARTKSNPYETIRGIFFLNRAAMKMANLDAVTDFLFTNPKKPDGHSLVEPGELLYFADVCAGPGGFSEYILWRKKWEAKGFGFTLKGSHDFKLEDFFAAPSECFEPHYGVGGLDGDGNVYTPDNLRVFRKFVMDSTDNKGVHFVMADGGFDVDGRENDQEWLSKRLYLCECTAALSILRTGGHFVCKLFDVFLVYSVGLIYLMYLAFEEVAIFKPVTSRPANSERYLICKGLRPGAHVIHDFLFETNLRFAQLGETAPTDINEIVPVDVLSTKQDFVEYIVTSNESLGVKQAIALSKIKAFAQNPQLYESRQAEMREECCRLWKIPEHARVAPDKSIKPQDKFKSLVKAKDLDCFTCQPEMLSPENLEVIKSVYDYRCYLAAGDRRWFLLGLGKSYVYKWDGVVGSGRWQKVDLKIELPADTLIEAEFVQELRGEGKGQRRVMAVHVLDAVVLGGRDVQELHYTERLEKLAKFVKAITRPTRGDLAPIRVKEIHRLEQMEEVFSRLTMRVVKGSGGQRRLCYCPQVAREEFMPTGVYFIKTVKEPWMLAFSHSKNRKYYFNSLTAASTFDTPKEVIAPFSYSHKHLLFWPWDAGVQMHESQPPSAPGRLSRDAMLAFITSRIQR